MSTLTHSSRAPGLYVGEDVTIDPSAEIGVGVVLYDHVRIEAGCVIEDRATIGKVPRLTANSSAPRAPSPPAVIEDGATVCTAAILYVGVRVCRGAIVGDMATMRERAVLGVDSVLGRLSGLGCDVVVGARVRIQNLSGLVTGTVVEDDAFIGPRVTTIDADWTPGSALQGATIRRGARLGARVTIFPGVEIGAGATVGAYSLVNHDVAPGTTVAGIPARVLEPKATAAP